MAKSLDGMPGTTLDAAVAASNADIELPPESAVGKAVKAVITAGNSVSPNEGATQRAGLSVLYSGGVLFSAEPLVNQPAPDYRAKLASPDTDALRWEDGRKQPFSILVINGRDTAVQPGGVRSAILTQAARPMRCAATLSSRPSPGSRIVSYVLRSDTLSSAELQAIAQQIEVSGYGSRAGPCSASRRGPPVRAKSYTESHPNAASSRQPPPPRQ